MLEYAKSLFNVLLNESHQIPESHRSNRSTISTFIIAGLAPPENGEPDDHRGSGHLGNCCNIGGHLVGRPLVTSGRPDMEGERANLKKNPAKASISPTMAPGCEITVGSTLINCGT